MLQLFIIRPSGSQTEFHVNMVATKNESDRRLYGNYISLGRQTVTDRYPITHIQDFTNGLQCMDIFTETDLVMKYLNIPVAEEDIRKTKITTCFGPSEFLRMPFDIKNPSQTTYFGMCFFVQGNTDNLLITSPIFNHMNDT